MSLDQTPLGEEILLLLLSDGLLNTPITLQKVGVCCLKYTYASPLET